MRETDGDPKSSMTIYNLTKEYEITKQGLRRWEKEKWKNQSLLLSAGE